MQDVQNVLYAALGFSRVALRARRRYTGARRPKLLQFISRHSNTHRKQTRCAKLPFCKRRAASPQPVSFPGKMNYRGVFRCVVTGFLRPEFWREYRLLALRTARLKGAKPMARVKRGTKRRARRKKYLKRTKGFFLTKSKLYQSAQEAANRADRYAFRDRRVKKREYRRLWIQRIGAAARQNGLTYGQLIHGLEAAGVTLDRKVLADLAVLDAAAFAQLAQQAKAAAPPQKKKA